MMPYWPKLASLAQKTYTLDSFQFFGVILVAKYITDLSSVVVNKLQARSSSIIVSDD